MKLTRAIAISVIAASLGLAAAVHAQSLKNVDTPSEFPPASYSGKQYVDSKGCVYIRAGVDGATTWVPRMTRDRKVICGYKPSIPNAKPNTSSAAKLDKNVVVIQPAAAPTTETAAAPAPKPKPKPKPTPKPATTPPATTPPAKTTTTTTTTAATTTATKPATTTATTTKPKSNTSSWWNWGTKPATTTTTTPKPPASQPESTTTTTTTTTTKPATTNTRRTLDQPKRQTGYSAPCRDGARAASGARCGPQAELPYTPGTGNPTAPPPRIIYKRQGAALAPGNLPVGTVVRQGQVAANTRVVPMHLYENHQYANSKRKIPDGYRAVFDDGRLNPHRAEQTFAGKASMDSLWDQSVPRKQLFDDDGNVVLSTKSMDPAPAGTVIVSTKSTPDEKAIRLSGQAYVQVQTYSDAAAAQKAARQIRAMGLPAKIGKYTRNGQTYRIVLAGPYRSQDQASAAATQAQKAGYSSAFVRN